MSDVKPATVYAYLDLAVCDEARSAWMVPQSDGGEWISTRESGAYRMALNEIKPCGACPIGIAGHIAVMGDVALEVAEREVREAANKWKRRMRTVSCVAKDRTLDGEDAVFIRYGDKEVEDGVYRASVYPELARAVDLRDRLRAKLAETGTKFVQKEELRIGIDYANGPEKTHIVASTIGANGKIDSVSVAPPLSVEAVKFANLCRLYGRNPEDVHWLPFVYDGREHAHAKCLERKTNDARPSPSVHWIIPGTVGPACWTANGLIASPPFDLNNHPELVTCLSCQMVIANHDKAKAALREPEEQPVFLATLRPSEPQDRENGWRPWTIRGDGWTWYMDNAQADELKSTGKTRDTFKNGTLVVFVAKDWKSTVAVSANIESAIKGFKRVSEALVAARISTEDFARARGHNQEVRPMPEKPKPDPIEVRAVRDLDRVTLYVIDRSRRTKCALVPAGVSRTTHPDEMDVSVRWVEVQEGERLPAFLRLSMEAFDNLSIVTKALAEILALSYATLPPLVIECDGLPTKVREEIAEDFKREQPGRSVVVLPHGARVADAQSEPAQSVSEDISRRADLAAASRKSLRWGAVLGLVAGLALACAAFFAVARIKPEWLAQRHRVPPAVMDEHARESEDARANGDGEEGR